MCSLTEPFLAIHCLQKPQCILSSFAQVWRVVRATGGARRACLFSGLRRIGKSCVGSGVEAAAGAIKASCLVWSSPSQCSGSSGKQVVGSVLIGAECGFPSSGVTRVWVGFVAFKDA